MLDEPPSGGSDVYRRAVEAHQAGDLATAEAAYREAAEAGESDAAFWLGWLLHDRDDLAGAVEAYEQAAARGHPEATLNMALLLARDLQRPEDARRLFEDAIERGDRRAMFDLGYLLWELGDHTGAAAAFNKAADAGDPRAHLELGFLLADQERDEEALTEFEEAASLGVDEAWTQAGWQLARLGRLDEAEAVLRRAWEQGDRVSGDILHDVLTALGRRDEAEAVLREAIKWARTEVSLDYRQVLAKFNAEELPDDELKAWAWAEDDRTPLELAALLYDAARLAEAETRLKLAIENGDDEAAAKLTELYEKTGRRDQAEQLRQRARPSP